MNEWINQSINQPNHHVNSICKLLSNPSKATELNLCSTLVGDKIVDHSDVVEALPVGAAPTTSSFST